MGNSEQNTPATRHLSAADTADLTGFWDSIPQHERADRNTAADADAVATLTRLLNAQDADGLAMEVQTRSASDDAVVLVIAHNSPFITDSLLATMGAHGAHTRFFTNKVVHRANGPDAAVFYAEVDPLDNGDLDSLGIQLRETLLDLRAVVDDFDAMKAKLRDARVAVTESGFEAEDSAEALAFIDWLSEEHFVFLGYREFDYSAGTLRQVAGSELGTLRRRKVAGERAIADQDEAARTFLMAPEPVAFSRSGTRSRVHRAVYPDYIGIKRCDAEGNVTGELGFLGLYTSRVYQKDPASIPIVRRKLAAIDARSAYPRGSHDAKTLHHVLWTFPRDEMFGIPETVLEQVAHEVTWLHDRHQVRLFTRADAYGLFVTALVYVPRDLYDSRIRLEAQRIIGDAVGAEDCEYEPWFSESALVRLQLVFRLAPGSRPQLDDSALTRRLQAVTHDWPQELRHALSARHGSSTAQTLGKKYRDAFGAGYRERYSAGVAAADIDALETLGLDGSEQGAVHFTLASGQTDQAVTLRIVHGGSFSRLSRVVPMLENLGFEVLGEHRSVVNPADSEPMLVQEFALEHELAGSLRSWQRGAIDCLLELWHGGVADDAFNRLVAAAGCTWQQANMLRAYARYMRQLPGAFSDEFVAATLATHAGVATALVDLFQMRFDPAAEAAEQDEIVRTRDVLAAIDAVPVLNEDRVLRKYAELIQATMRTSFYQPHADSLVFKLRPALISDVPAPVPNAEMFVHAPTIEGVHLRFGAVARGGLRWSDRLEDYRTEVLGLVKAQVVKNAVIVPTGAKGGFVLTAPIEGEAGYRTFIRGLLSVTDNIVDGTTVAPEGVRVRDDEDPYLVVAADKGTAAFSDVANEIAMDAGFWLGDAFASGGSVGYDHKKLGITARGAWRSVERHFEERGIDVANDPVSVLGIGDMSGDVFGNGMLQSTALKLVAAFNHLHIFVDPDPEPAASHAERQRLFELPRSMWTNYDENLLSPGGVIFDRSAKQISLTPQIQARFGIEADVMSPDEFIHELLRSDVDLIFNGGVGTYVKASTETHAEAQDRGNDGLRVDACELRCKVIGEGGNLGLTHAARIEFALAGGAVNTDFIDNSAGVDCSDREVNLKIALGALALGEAERAALIADLSDEVVNLVLSNNRRQARALSLGEAAVRRDAYGMVDLIGKLEAGQGLDRILEGVPEDETILTRGLSRPELAVVMAYAKMDLKSRLLETSFDADGWFDDALLRAFPTSLLEQHPDIAADHRLRREITATQWTNDVVHRLGIGFVCDVEESANAGVDAVSRAIAVTDELFDVFAKLDALEHGQAPVAERDEATLTMRRQVRRACTWLLRNGLGAEPILGVAERLRVALGGADIEALPTVLAALQERSNPATALARAASLDETLRLAEIARLIDSAAVDSPWDRLEARQLADDVTHLRARAAAVEGLAEQLEGPALTRWLGTVGQLNLPDAGISDPDADSQPDLVQMRVVVRRLQDQLAG